MSAPTAAGTAAKKAPAKKAAPAAAASSSTSSPAASGSAAAAGDRVGTAIGEALPYRSADSGAGFVFGVMLWALTMAYLNPTGRGRGGVQGVRDLVRAKFFNKGRTGEMLS